MEPFHEAGDDREFSAYLAAFAHCCKDTFHYDVMGNYIVLPTTALTPSDLFEYIHELSHSQLGNGVLGMTIQTLTELLCCLERELFVRLRELISPLRSLGLCEQRCHFDLFVYGRPQSATGDSTSLPAEIIGQLQKSWLSAQRDGDFQMLMDLFLEIRRRLQCIWEHWLPIHEGLAVFSAIDICLGEDEDAKEQVTTAVRRLGPLMPDSDSSEVRKRVRDLALLERERWRKGKTCSALYLNGFRLCESAAQVGVGRAAAWIAALASSHFPYHCCDLLDMSHQQFDDWLKHGEFNFQRRFRTLLAQPATLQELVDELKTDDGLSIAAMEQALSIMRGPLGLNQLSEPARRFGSWERDYLWRSRLFSTYLDSRRIDLQSMGIERLAIVDDDRTADFRIPGHWTPPLVVPSEARSLISGHEEYGRLRRRFMNVYDVERTTALLNWFVDLDYH